MPDMELTINAHGNTHIGRVRATNQDSYLCDNKRFLYMVADGMGGHAGGEVASSLAVSNIRSFLDSNFPLDASLAHSGQSQALGILADAINHASMKIYERALEEPSLKGMGTTATVVRINGRSLVCGHVGDSRLYLIRFGYIYQITTDHSLVSEQLRAGMITKEVSAIKSKKTLIRIRLSSLMVIFLYFAATACTGECRRNPSLIAAKNTEFWPLTI
jgi:protein phosphatase